MVTATKGVACGDVCVKLPRETVGDLVIASDAGAVGLIMSR
jgi:hypothetical protein